MKTLICDAIKNKSIIKITYNHSTRTCEPHLLGYDSTNDLTLSVWQLSGKSGTGWRDYHISKASDISITDKNFVSARPDYNQRDKTIYRVVCSL